MLLDNNYTFERPASVDINKEQQISLARIVYPLNLNETVAFKVDASHIQLEKVEHFDEENAFLHIYLKETQRDKVTFSLILDEPLKIIDQKMVIKSEIIFTKQKKLKKVILKHFQNYIAVTGRQFVGEILSKRPI